MALRLAVVSLLALHAQAALLQAAPAPAAAGAPGAGAPAAPEIQYSKAFEKDWHKEWKQGDFPSWKKVIKVDGIEQYEDRQSDGKPGFLQAAPAPAAAGAPTAPAAPEIQYHKDFEKDWHKEWKQGDYPSWKKVIEVDGKPAGKTIPDDRQSDGKPGL